MARASYRTAIEWLAGNDDNEWLNEFDEEMELNPSVSAALVADLFGKTDAQIVTDLRKALRRLGIS